MSERVNLPPVVIHPENNPFKPGTPEALYISKLNSANRQMRIIIEQLFRRTGGGNDAITEIQIGELYEPGIQIFDPDEAASEIEADTGYLEQSVYEEFEPDIELSSRLDVITERLDETLNDFLYLKEGPEGSETDSSLFNFDERISELEADISHIEAISLSVLNTISELGFSVREMAAGDTTITTAGNELIICNNTAAGTVTMNTSPEDGERVIIKRRNAKITISGTVDGQSNPVLISKYDGVQLVYSLATAEWSIV